MDSDTTITLKTIELDVAYGTEAPFDETLEQALADMTAGTQITHEVVDPHGPGGGWPVVAFTGPDAELRTMLRDKYGADTPQGESVAFYMGEED